ncbi:MAG: molybdopterin molybdotransferase MoeA [Gammaproteobacteria bacterium]|nr:molybdopterin molybdotransferase MoeA [Gammaproteobacteria bacterium]MBI5618138.1 molybdopterin molybdotransferase MoeA [Gammaproteobacteria bacterium]
MSADHIEACPSCDDDFDPISLDCAEALARVLAATSPVTGTQTLPLRDALDRVLAAPVVAGFDVPGEANSAMDGYAVRAADLPADGTLRLQIVDTSFAGRPAMRALGPGETIRIMTGAVLPAGADTVVMQEHVTVEGDRIVVGSGHRAGQNVRLPGEDVRRGATVLAAGKRLTPADLGLAASLNVAELVVHRRPRVAFFSTGDELKPVGSTLGPGEIYDSNRYTLFGMLTRLGVECQDLGVVGDDRAALAAAFAEAASRADAVITSGGVSVGEADYTRDTLVALGSVAFWRVAMKPGRPLAFGHLNGALFFGLPGNPVSVMATFYQIVQPALEKLAGLGAPARVVVKARTTTGLRKRPGRVDFQRGRLATNPQGELCVTPLGKQGSGVLSSMSEADCFVILPMTSGDVAAGELVDVQPFFGLV